MNKTKVMETIELLPVYGEEKMVDTDHDQIPEKQD